MTATRIHFLTLDPGDMFKYKEDGPVYRRGPDTRDGRATVLSWGPTRAPGDASSVPADSAALGHEWRPAGIQEYEGCFVIPIDDPDDEQEDRP